MKLSSLTETMAFFPGGCIKSAASVMALLVGWTLLIVHRLAAWRRADRWWLHNGTFTGSHTHSPAGWLLATWNTEGKSGMLEPHLNDPRGPWYLAPIPMAHFHGIPGSTTLKLMLVRLLGSFSWRMWGATRHVSNSSWPFEGSTHEVGAEGGRGRLHALSEASCLQLVQSLHEIMVIPGSCAVLVLEYNENACSIGIVL